MPIVRFPQLSFTSGQITTQDVVGEAIEGRSNLEVFKSGLKTCRNWIPLPQGPIYKRPAFAKIAEETGAIKICEFVFNESQFYLFVFKHLTLDVYNGMTDAEVATGIVTPWTAAQLATMKPLQSKDTWIGFHPDVPMTKIVRGGSHSSWTVTTISITSPPQFDFGSGAEACWSVTRGYPLTGMFHDNRLVIGGSKSLPESIWGSKAGGLFDFGTGSAEDDGFAFHLNSLAVNKVQHIASIRGEIIVNTSMGEWTETSDYISATNVAFKLNTRHGMLDTGIRALDVDSSNLFVDRNNRLRSFGFDFSSDSFIARNLSVLAPGLLTNPTSAAYFRGFVNSANLAAFRNSDGTLAMISLDMEQQVKGWNTVTLGDGTFLDVCAVNDQLYALVSYNSKTFLTKLTTAQHLDIWSTGTSGSPTASWTGFTDFANKTISVFGDGMWFESVAVNGSGNFTLPRAVEDVIVGVSYTAFAELMDFVPDMNGQLMVGTRMKKLYAEVNVRNTRDLWIDGRRVELRRLGNDLLDAEPPEQDEMIRVRLTGISTAPTVTIESRAPLGAMVLNIITALEVRDPRE